MRQAIRQRKPPAATAAYDVDEPRRWVALGVLLLAAAMDLIDTTVALLVTAYTITIARRHRRRP